MDKCWWAAAAVRRLLFNFCMHHGLWKSSIRPKLQLEPEHLHQLLFLQQLRGQLLDLLVLLLQQLVFVHGCSWS